ncbi:MAG: hypothetical protein IJ513_08110, partial [Bacteroidaceae bacterium]|nr:hypothetical protein [Bacteroidaceae bacterium]
TSQALYLRFLEHKIIFVKEWHQLRYACFCKRSFRFAKLPFPKTSQALHLRFLEHKIVFVKEWHLLRYACFCQQYRSNYSFLK